MERYYKTLIDLHLENDNQMIFLAGPRQVGKTTIAQSYTNFPGGYHYLNWDDTNDRNLILDGNQAIEQKLTLHIARSKKQLVIFDEIHKYKNWKLFLKALFDKHKEKLHIIVTGSAKLNIYQKSSDSLMGRYFLYRIHPLSIAELTHSSRIFDENEITTPTKMDDSLFNNLLNFGGYPEPYIKSDSRFSNRWQNLRAKQLFREDILELSHVNEIVLLEQLSVLLTHQVGDLLVRDSLAKKLQVASTTIKNWIEILEQTYYCYTVQPWSTNITRSLIKTPKLYLWDWSTITNEGKRLENMVASHLLKAVHFWTDAGLGNYRLCYIRNKDKQEVDFVVIKNEIPWFLVEVKTSSTKLSSSLSHFHNILKTQHAFQVVKNLSGDTIDCFSYTEPVIVPMNVFLSQLI